MIKLTDNFYVNSYEKGISKFVVITDKKDKSKTYSINAALLEYILEHPKKAKEGK